MFRFTPCRITLVGILSNSSYLSALNSYPKRDYTDKLLYNRHLVTAELRNVHVARMRFTPMTSSRSPASSAKQLGNQGEYHIRSIFAIKWAPSGDEFVVKVAWEGLEEAEITWEPVSRVFHDAPAVLRKELKALRLKAEHKPALVQRYGLRL